MKKNLTSKIQKTIAFLSAKDELTGLPNTAKFKKDAAEILKNAAPGEYSIITLDICDFRYIIDSFGEENAQKIIQQLAFHFKEASPEGTIFCRNFMDNFTLLIRASLRVVLEDIIVNITSIDDALVDLVGDHYEIRYSVGVYVITDTKEDVQSMMNKSETARSIGKHSLTPYRIYYYTEEMRKETTREKEILRDMNRAFDNGEFVVYYQPKFDFSSGKVIGAEALIRWKHEEKGLLVPGEFVPFFEKNGFIQKIDILVFTDVCRFLDAWNKSGPDESCPYPITISCNLSRMGLYNPDMVETYKKIANKYQIAPSKIEIELTESLMMDNKRRLLAAMNEIQDAGFSISIDDFGSGFSSLSLLKDIPATVIKLDKEFLNGTNNEKEYVIIKSVINMAKDLNIKTVAEGVEEKIQSEKLKELGCDIVQGFYYAKPMKKNDYIKLLKKPDTFANKSENNN